MNSASDQLVLVEHRSYAVHNVIACLLYVVGYHILELDHSVPVHISRACDEVLLVIVLACQLEADEMATVVKAAAAYEIAVVLLLNPTRRLDVSYISSRLGGHHLSADTRHNVSASAEAVKLAEELVANSGDLVSGKGRLIAVYCYPRLAGVEGHAEQLAYRILIGRRFRVAVIAVVVCAVVIAVIVGRLVAILGHILGILRGVALVRRILAVVVKSRRVGA